MGYHGLSSSIRAVAVFFFKQKTAYEIWSVTGVQTCALPISWRNRRRGLRDLGLKSEPRRLLRHVRGAELVELPNAESCCGFGGTFSVKHPEISVAMLDEIGRASCRERVWSWARRVARDELDK